MRTPLRRYLRGANLVTLYEVQSGARRVYHFDHQGTTQCLTDSTGAVTDRFASDAWGVQVKRMGSSSNHQWYKGEYGYDRATGQELLYIRARWLRPPLGRFESYDRLPSIFQSPGLYSYGMNSPSEFVDPSGNITVSPFKKTQSTTSCGSWNIAFNFVLDKPAPTGGGFIVQMIIIAESITECKRPRSKFKTTVFWEAFAVEAGQRKYFKQARSPIDLGTDTSREPAHPNSRGSVAAVGTVKFFSARTLASLGVGGGTGDIYRDASWWTGTTGNVGEAAGGIPSTFHRPPWFFGRSDDPPDGSRAVASEWCCCPPVSWSRVSIWINENVVDHIISGEVKSCKTCDEQQSA